MSILSIKLYRVLKERFQLHVLLVTANPINTIVPCAEGLVSAACSAGYCKYYQYNYTVCWRTIFRWMFCWLLSILLIQKYRVQKGMFQLVNLLVTANPINKCLPCAEGYVSAACFACYCQSFLFNFTVCWRAGFIYILCRLLSIPSIQLYRVLKYRILLHVLRVAVNPIKTIVRCA